MDVDSKVAIVTGGAVRLGRAIALALAEAGVRIGLHYSGSSSAAVETVDAITRGGGQAVPIQADFRSPEASHAVVEQTVAAFGQVDILINSAAIFEECSLATANDDQWERHFAINLKAPFFLCQEFARQLGAHRRGHIINIADWRALRPGSDHLIYTLTKGALVTMTHCLAQQLAPRVQVNAIAPGAILPPPGHDERFLDAMAQEIPLRRAGTPADIARTALFLLESDFITGEVVLVTGGQHL